MIKAEWLIGYIWWEGKAGWNLITWENRWPPLTEATVTIAIKNTGDQTAIFSVRFLGEQSAGIGLSPGERGDYSLYPTTPAEGTHRIYLEIWANGVKIITYGFDLISTGEPEEPEPPPLPFMDWIVNRLADISDFFGALYHVVFDWIPPFNKAAPFFYSLYVIFYELTYDFSDFRDWVNYVQEKVFGLGLWVAIKALIIEWLPGLESAIVWFSDWWDKVRANIESWWQITISTVQGMIDLATQGLESLLAAWDNFTKVTLPGVLGELDGLWAAWSDFWTTTFPTLVSFTWLGTWWNSRIADIQDLINTAFTLRESLWSGWQDIKDQVIEFFADPEDWLYKAFYRIVERFW